MTITAEYRDGHLIPLDKIDLKTGDVVEISILKKYKWKGALKSIKESSVKLQHKARDMW